MAETERHDPPDADACGDEFADDHATCVCQLPEGHDTATGNWHDCVCAGRPGMSPTHPSTPLAARRPQTMPDPTAPERSDVELALDAVDRLLMTEAGFDALTDGDLDTLDAWANNIQLDIMRYRYRREGARRG